MNPITPALLLQLLLQYGPTIVPMVQKLVADIEAGKANATVSSDDLAALTQLANQSAADIYKRMGVTPPATVVAS